MYFWNAFVSPNGTVALSCQRLPSLKAERHTLGTGFNKSTEKAFNFLSWQNCNVLLWKCWLPTCSVCKAVSSLMLLKQILLLEKGAQDQNPLWSRNRSKMTQLLHNTSTSFQWWFECNFVSRSLVLHFVTRHGDSGMLLLWMPLHQELAS